MLRCRVRPQVLLVVSLLVLPSVALALPSDPIRPFTTHLYAPLEGIVVTSTGDTVALAGTIHVVVHVGVPSDPMRIYANLVGVEGVGTSGNRYLGLGAVSLTAPFTPSDPIVPVDPVFTLLPVGSAGFPSDPILPGDPMRVRLTLIFSIETGQVTAIAELVGT